MKGLLKALLLLLLLFGCANQKLRQDGQTLIDEGRYEEGLEKLQEAVKSDPNNASYRAELSRNKENITIRLLAEAEGERKANEPEAAKSSFNRVLRIDPGNRRAAEGLESLAADSRHAELAGKARESLDKGDREGADEALHRILIEDPEYGPALKLQKRIEAMQASEAMAAPSLQTQFRKPVTLQFRDANIKMVFEALSRVAGINILLDKDVRPDLKVSIFVKDISVEDTIDLILMQSALMKKVISDNTVFIYPDTPAKVKEYQELVIRSFHLTNADPKQMLTMLKTVLKTKDIFINEKTNSIVMRDTPDAVRLAEKMIADQDIPEPEVMMEVEVLEVNRSRLTDLGLNWPSQFTLTATGTATTPGTATPSATPTLTQLKHINSDNIITSPPLSVALKALLQDSDTDIIASPRIRARNREKAKIMIGDRVPVITNAVTPVASGAPVVTGNVQYLDVGMKLEVEPDIHADDQVAIKINLDVSSIVQQVQNAASGTLAYQIGTRNASTLLQLKDGETQILAGLIDNEMRNTANKVPGLGQMPVLGKLFSENQGNGTKTEIILSLTPHIIGRPKEPKARDLEYWSGTEDAIKAKSMELRPVAKPLPKPSEKAPEKTLSQKPLAFSWQGPRTAKIGDRIDVNLDALSGLGWRNLGLMVNYDPKVLKAIRVQEGDIMRKNRLSARLSQTIDPEKGQIAADLAGSGATSTEATGRVLSLQFEVLKESAASRISVLSIRPSGERGEVLPADSPPPYTIAVGP